MRWRLAVAVATIALAAMAAIALPHKARVVWQIASAQVVAPSVPQTADLPATPEARALIRAAESQIGVVISYDPSYTKLAYPMGDVASDRGVCTDVPIRALREAFAIDLQASVHTDMKANFDKYPANWGLKSADSNIDHRRVPNLQTFFTRMGATVSGDYLPGDIVTSLLPGNLTHITIVTDHMGAAAPMIVHNIGAGTRVEDRLFEFEITGHFRLTPAVLARMRAL